MEGQEMARFIVCVSRDVGEISADDLSIGKLYEVSDEKHNCFTIVDDSGEEYVYPQSCFVRVSVPQDSAGMLHEALTKKVA